MFISAALVTRRVCSQPFLFRTLAAGFFPQFLEKMWAERCRIRWAFCNFGREIEQGQVFLVILCRAFLVLWLCMCCDTLSEPCPRNQWSEKSYRAPKQIAVLKPIRITTTKLCFSQPDVKRLAVLKVNRINQSSSQGPSNGSPWMKLGFRADQTGVLVCMCRLKSARLGLAGCVN